MTRNLETYKSGNSEYPLELSNLRKPHSPLPPTLCGPWHVRGPDARCHGCGAGTLDDLRSFGSTGFRLVAIGVVLSVCYN